MKYLAFLMIALAAAPALAQPSYWRVTGVAADDTLNVRAGPSASSDDIGDLAPGATGIELIDTDASGNWGRIIWQESHGWIATRFLAPDPQPAIPGTGLPVGLLCAGTEPFWDLRLSAGGAVYSDISGTAMALGQTGAAVAQNRAFPVQLSHASPTAASLASIFPVLCSDGMSDRDYPWRILLNFNTATEQKLLDGCCRLPLEAGMH